MADPVAHLTEKLVVRQLARTADWQICEFTCSAGINDRPFEEQHDGFTIAAVLEGVFTYRSGTGRELLHPGALLLGNHGRCFECGHDHSNGDRCISINYRPDFFAEIATSVAGSSRFRFPTGMLPQKQMLALHLAGLETITHGMSLQSPEEIAITLAEAVLSTVSDKPLAHREVAARDERRIAASIRYIEERYRDPLELSELADVAHMSKYHFLRTFRCVTGSTPYQYLLSVRMRQAAIALTVSPANIADVAYEMGFGDLSTFNERFRRVYCAGPSEFRAKNRRRQE
ncbi:AraC family transcriptional regulator [Microvirga arabica]|uniref:AraC family transcriptional regulator n=1 Tax=Microvirga arabica TaxID=1128671 RepID=UPI00193AAA84|nr:AraC family transcriptional regulator [Microvirga arabica]MBM1172542.1 helix-turn-helix transcriptional regulator [Microvirga arabica]